MPLGNGCLSFPLWPRASTAPSSIVTLTPLGMVIGLFPIRDMVFSPLGRARLRPARADDGRPYQILQSTSPPTPALTASRPVITPREVVRMLVPRPASTSGTSDRPK